MRVLLISPNRIRHPYPVYPLGLDYVAAALSGVHEVQILDLCPLRDEQVLDAVAGAIRSFAPDAVGVSVRNVDNTDQTATKSFLGDVQAVVRAIRDQTRSPVVLGGAGFTMFPAEILEATGADYGLVGEGERAAELFDSLGRGVDPSGLPAVAKRGGSRPEVVPLGPATTGRRLVPPPNPALPFYLSNGGVLSLQTQRGCSCRCIYCCYPLIEGRCVRRRSAADVAAEAVALQSAGARYLVVTDSVFNSLPSHALEVASAFRRAGLAIPWGAYFAPVSPPAGFYDRMAESGCSHVEFGTEALSDPMLERIRKSFRRKDVFDAHRAARAAGLNVAHFMLLGGPGESEATLQETLNAADEIPDAAFFFFCGMRIYPGTELERFATSAGFVQKGASLLAPVFFEPRSVSLATIETRLRERAASRPNWVVGDGADRTLRAMSALYARGHTGPIWELMVTP